MEHQLVGKAIKYLDPPSTIKLGEVLDHKDDIISCRELIRPEETKSILYSDKRHIYCGDRELYRTNNFFEIPLSSVQETIPIISLQDYPNSKGFLIRQIYDQNSRNFSPQSLPFICLCQQPLNPDMPYIICQKCNQTFHASCLTDLNSCPDCSLVFKRIRSEEIEPESPKKQLKATISAKSRNIDKSSLPLDSDKYPNLSEESREKLQNNVLNVHLNFLALQSSLTNEEKIRQQLICKVVCALYLSIEENKGLKYTLQELEKRAMEIEASIYYSTGSKANSPNYKNKVRSILFNLCDEKNPDFRYHILKGEIEASELSKMQSRDMASSAIKNFRHDRQKKYTEEQLVLPESDDKLMVKTHKGEAVFNIGDVMNDMTSTDILDTILTKSKSADKPKKIAGEEDDPFNPENHQEHTKEYGLEQKDGVGINSQIFEIVKDWTPMNLQRKLNDTLHNYLEASQAKRVVSRIKFLSDN